METFPNQCVSIYSNISIYSNCFYIWKRFQISVFLYMCSITYQFIVTVSIQIVYVFLDDWKTNILLMDILWTTGTTSIVSDCQVTFVDGNTCFVWYCSTRPDCFACNYLVYLFILVLVCLRNHAGVTFLNVKWPSKEVVFVQKRFGTH